MYYGVDVVLYHKKRNCVPKDENPWVRTLPIICVNFILLQIIIKLGNAQLLKYASKS